MKNNLAIIGLVLLFCSSITTAQIKFTAAGAGFGYGSIKGNSASVDALTANINTDFKLWFSQEVTFRISYAHARMIEYFIPENRLGKYYPFLNIYSLSANIWQPLSEGFFLEESAGLTLANDRTFSDVNTWDGGATFGLTAGLDFRENDLKGFTVGLGYNFGITVAKTSVSYSFITLQAKYYY